MAPEGKIKNAGNELDDLELAAAVGAQLAGQARAWCGRGTTASTCILNVAKSEKELNVRDKGQGRTL